MKICILYTNSGAGHLAAARALKSAFENLGIQQIKLVDFAVEYKIPLYSKAQKSYKFILNNTISLQSWIVKFFDLSIPAFFFRKLFRLLSKKEIEKFIKDYPADIYISTYYTDTEVFKMIKKQNQKTKVVMVVVDIMHALRLWFDPVTDLVILPTQEMFEQANKYCKNYSEKLELFGLPIAQNIFSDITKEEMKREFGLNSNPMIFVAGGGEGMEQVPEIVKNIDLANNNINICVVCGKDLSQKEYLESQNYKNNVKVFGWVNNFTEFIIASDIVITKAGPATVWETISAGRKLILYGFIGGVEEGDVDFATRNGEVVFEKDSKKIANLIPLILSKPCPVVSEQFKTNWAKKVAARTIELGKV